MRMEQRLDELKIALPVLPPLAATLHAKQVGNLLYLDGKGPATRRAR